jgi:nicotinate-nucleotide--dimethylbenzimidazole phosphoribosyltransferase
MTGGMTEHAATLDRTLAAIRGPDPQAVAAARLRQDQLTKPRGSLGRLEDVSVQLAGLAGMCPPPHPAPVALAIFAGDHGVHAQGVTPWPQEVTGQMVANFLAGGAVATVLARQTGARVCVVDVGLASPVPAEPELVADPAGQGGRAGDEIRLWTRRVRAGTGDLAVGAAMTRAEALAALAVGIEVAEQLVADGARCLLTGDMGIANTTPSATLVAAFTGADAAEATGRGTGIDDATHARKVEVVRAALALHRPDPADPVGVLAAVGGLEHAALAGFALAGAALRVPVLLDGVIAGSAALVAAALAPDAVAAWVAGHRSVEPGHALALQHLGLHPLIDLDLRLGEGSGALLALPLLQSAVRVLAEVATFDAAGVVDKDA